MQNTTLGSALRRVLRAAALLALAAVLLAGSWELWQRTRPVDAAPQGDTPLAAFPLDAQAPWPKFRANALQNGRTPLVPRSDPAHKPWVFYTGKGIFSSPVIDAQGTVYIGSADQRFYAIDAQGRERWHVQTGEIIDSSALLDDRGRVYFGSGDAQVYAVDRSTGQVVWTSAAHSTQAVRQEFGIQTYNVNWFEGNIGMLPDGTLLAPNDNYLVYALARDTGQRQTQFLGNEMVWSLPAVNPRTGRLFFGTTNLALRTLLAYDYAAPQKPVWATGGLGSIAASPLLTSTREGALVVAGGFDGYVRAWRQSDGREVWATALRDHVYASAAQQADGTLVVPSADGTVYALDPANGQIRWQFDTLEPIRSSPAIDGNGVVYVGSGEGRLFAINPDGRLRWAYRLIDGARNDLNSSPALGPQGVVIAGENGGVYMVPYDYCLQPAGARDARCQSGPHEDLPSEGVFMLPTGPFGQLEVHKSATIDAHQALTFSLLVRARGDTVVAELVPDSLRVDIVGAPGFDTDIAAHGRFVTLTPKSLWTAASGGMLEVRFQGRYRTGMHRFGLKTWGNGVEQPFSLTQHIAVRPYGTAPMPYAVPDAQGVGAHTVLELSRLSVPNPTMLPSWNQIGFDSLHYLAGTVARQQQRTLLWVVSGKLTDGKTVVDASQPVRFPLWMDWNGGLVTLHNEDGFKIQFVGSWDMPFARYRISAVADASGQLWPLSTLSATALCDEIAFYGKGLKLMGLSDWESGKMTVFGGLNLGLWKGGSAEMAKPSDAASVHFSVSPEVARAELPAGLWRADHHVYSVLVTDTDNNPLPLYYTRDTDVQTDPQGSVRAVQVKLGAHARAGQALILRLMSDNHIVAQQTLSRP